MKKWPAVVLLGSFLLISLLSVGGNGKGVDGNNVYYDGTIKVITKGTNKSGDTFDESTIITGFKIAHWNVIPRKLWQGYDSVGTRCSAQVKVNDRLGEVTFAFGPGKVPYEGGQMLSLQITKTAEGFKYAIQAVLPTPPLNPPVFPSCVMGMAGETLGDDFMPLEISGKTVKSSDGVTTTSTWVLSRHIK